MSSYAKILNFDEFNALRGNLGKIVATSGGFDPIHPGHTSCIIESKQYGDTLVVIVNGDDFLTRKKGQSFMDLKTRCFLVSCIREVDYVIPFEIENDHTVCVALKLLKPDVFTKGGDRVDPASIPEWSVCQELGINVIFGVGRKKDWSSSDLLHEWEKFCMEKPLKIETNQPYDPLGHLKILASNFQKSYAFYEDIFSALNYTQISKKENKASWVKDGYAILLGQAKMENYKFQYGMPGIHHLCFKAKSPQQVDELYTLALTKEAHIYEPPKKYPEFTDKYYAVFFGDPDNIKIEVAYY